MYKSTSESRPNRNNNNNASTSNLNGLNGGGGGDVKINPKFSTKKFSNRLSFYDKAPTEELTLEEFETWAIDRLRVLSDIESSAARNRSQEELKKIVDARLKTYLPLSADSSNIDTDAERKKDQYSHFVLRLAFCRSEELRARYLKAETTLFKLRWEDFTVSDRQRFVESLNFGWEVVSDEEKQQHKYQLLAGSQLQNIENESFFKVSWTKVVDLVNMRRVFIHQGKAFVPSSQELSLVLAEFTSRLSKALELTAKALPRLDEDDRLLPILAHLSYGFLAGISSDYTISTGAEGEVMTAEMIPELARVSFPFCMRSMYDALKASKHLKHEGRLQFTLFLKGVGLSVEEAIIFWRKSFSCGDDKFNKEYKYNIRHTYGLEGSRKNYSPRYTYLLFTIISGKPPGPGESHGCPFKHYNEPHLLSSLSTTYNLSSPDTKEILGFVKSNHFHLACTRVFEIQHGVERGVGVGEGDSVDHPNRFFEASRKLRKTESDAKEAETKSDNENKNEKMKID